jgi:hypothetical protein
VPCGPCLGEDNVGACCLPGFTGGGIVRFDAGQAQIIVFAMRLEDTSSQQGTGFVRWIDSDSPNGPLTLESFGPITYESVPDAEEARDIRGIMRANGTGEHAFHLRVADYGPDRIGDDIAALSVGIVSGEASSGDDFQYEAQGTLIGGDFQLLNSVAPLPQT